MRRWTGLVILSALFALTCQPPLPVFDVLILNGRIIDGTGNPWFTADVGIIGDRIVEIGRLTGRRAQTTIDAEGHIVAPGFIDMLGQSEYHVLIDNRALNKISQGITTELNGEGESPAPLNDRIVSDMKTLREKYGVTVDWRDFDGYFRRVEERGSAINLATFVGATQVRSLVIGEEDRKATAEELEKMKQLVGEAMQQGALGLSTALEYVPAMFAPTEELIELAGAAAEHGGIYITHLRDEEDRIMEALYEAADIARAANIPVEVWHLKVAEKPNWGKMLNVVRLIQQFRNEGLDVTANQYPYIAFGNSLSSMLPGWVQEGGTAPMLDRLGDPQARSRIRSELDTKAKMNQMDYEMTMIASVANPELKQYEGKRLTEVARLMGKNPLDAALDFIVADSARTGRVVFAMTEQDLRMGMAQPWVSFCTDGGFSATDGPLSERRTHPRTWGSFPRILGKYVREEKLIPLEDAVRKMTSLPAARVGLHQRGILRVGFYADVVVFDPETVADRATFQEPNQFSVGINHVLVNGVPVWTDGSHTGMFPGRVLRGPGYRP